MVMNATEFRDKLFTIQNNSFPREAILPYTNALYYVDLKTRIINGPKYLSVLKDHNAETIYFAMPRYMNYIDLATTACIIQYKLQDGKTRLYPVLFYDITSLADPGHEKIIIPWVLGADVTQFSGEVEYSIRFYKIDSTGQKFIYNLNTLPTSGEILYGMDVDSEDFVKENYYSLPGNIYLQVQETLQKLEQEDLRWIKFK